MSQEVRTYLDDDVYDDICTEAENTGKSKSSIVNDKVRTAITDDDTDDDTNTDNVFMQTFGQALFVGGFIVGYYQSFLTGVLVGFMGLGIMLWTEMQTHLQNPDVGYLGAFTRTLGVA